MSFGLNQSLFTRLVQLYLLVFAFSVAVIVLEVLSPSLSLFAERFDRLVEQSFGAPNELLESLALWVGSVALLWHLICAAGLLGFKRWARWGFWASIGPMWFVELLPPFWSVSYYTPWMGVLGVVAEALLGAILLLAYSRDHGRVWFGTPLEKLKETF